MQPQLGGLAYLYTFSEATFLTNGPDYICTYVYDTKAQIAAELQYLENGTTLPMRALQVCREPHELIFPLTVESEKKKRKGYGLAALCETQAAFSSSLMGFSSLHSRLLIDRLVITNTKPEEKSGESNHASLPFRSGAGHGSGLQFTTWVNFLFIFFSVLTVLKEYQVLLDGPSLIDIRPFCLRRAAR